MKYAVITFGCRVNQSDSHGVEEQLLSRGAEPAPAEAADVVVVNTCTVTASADQGARQTIRRIARVNPSARIVVTGCYATREPDAVRQLPNVEHVVCNDDKPQLLTLLRPGAGPLTQDDPGGLTSSERYGEGDGACGAVLKPGLAGRTAFTLRVQTGCAEACSYCIIPGTRGAPRSLSLDAACREVQRVVRAGFKEVVLTGVHLGSWGRDLERPASLLTLLRALDELAAREHADHNRRVLFRISSLEPMDCTRDLVDLVAASPYFAPHFHLPLQHASASVLRAMRRPYDVGRYAALVDDIRARLPHASIGSDIIVGFPGEQEADVQELTTYLNTSPLTHLHVFPYSDRPGTEASTLRARPPGPAVKAWGDEVRRIGAALNRRFLASQVGTCHRALTLEDGTLAVTGNYLKARIAAGQPRNAWVQLRIRQTFPVIEADVIDAASPDSTQP